jgi:hypothetical protein
VSPDSLLVIPIPDHFIPVLYVHALPRRRRNFSKYSKLDFFHKLPISVQTDVADVEVRRQKPPLPSPSPREAALQFVIPAQAGMQDAFKNG